KLEAFSFFVRLILIKDMKAKLLILGAIAALSLTTPAFAKTRVVQTRNGQTVVANSSDHRNHWRGNHWRSGSRVFWNVGIGVPFYGGYYGGYPYYGSSYYGDIHMARMATVITLTDTDTIVTITTARPIPTTPVARFIGVTTDRLLPACRNGSLALAIITARSMA